MLKKLRKVEFVGEIGAIPAKQSPIGQFAVQSVVVIAIDYACSVHNSGQRLRRKKVMQAPIRNQRSTNSGLNTQLSGHCSQHTSQIQECYQTLP